MMTSSSSSSLAANLWHRRSQPAPKQTMPCHAFPTRSLPSRPSCQIGRQHQFSQGKARQRQHLSSTTRHGPPLLLLDPRRRPALLMAPSRTLSFVQCSPWPSGDRNPFDARASIHADSCPAPASSMEAAVEATLDPTTAAIKQEMRHKTMQSVPTSPAQPTRQPGFALRTSPHWPRRSPRAKIGPHARAYPTLPSSVFT